MMASAHLTPVAKEALCRLVASRDPLLPGVCVGVINTAGEIDLLESGGPRAIGSDAPLSKDAVFWIASCTKVVTAMACCQLIEQGKLQLDQTGEDILPALHDPEVLVDSSGEIRKARSKISLRMQAISRQSGKICS